MNLQSQSVTTALALYPLHFLQWVTPVLPAGTAHGGLPQSAFTPQGVEVVIEPFTGLRNWTMAAYDVAGIYVNGVFTGVTKTIFPGEENDRFLLHIPASWFVNGINNVFYRVKRLSGNSEDSIALDVLYHAPVAGITTNHPASVDPGQPGSVDININYARPYDTVTLTIGTWSITFTNFDHTKPITHPLTAADLQQIGVGNHPVSAIIRDQLSNSNVSPTTTIDIDTDGSPLVIDESDMVLDAVKFFQNYGWAAKEVPGNVAVRQAQGGKGSYVYKVDDPSVVSLTAQGRVGGLRSGETYVRVIDQAGSEVSYKVRVRNVFQIVTNPQTYSADAVGNVTAQQWIASQGGLAVDVFPSIVTVTTMTANFNNVFNDVFEGRPPEVARGACMAARSIPAVIGQGLHIGMRTNGDWYFGAGIITGASIRAIAFVPK